MKVAAIIAEYNPFHNGHEYHVKKTREAGYSHIIAIMSGDYVQRGSPAIADMFVRAKAAVDCGVDLVIALPLPWSMSAAPDFAKGAVTIIKATGITDCISFGCETKETDSFQKYADFFQDEVLQEEIKKQCKTGISYPNAVCNACKTTNNDQLIKLLETPNNLLGLEYCKHLVGTDIKILPIERIGCNHNDPKPDGEFASASVIREQFYKMYNYNPELYILYTLMPKASLAVLQEAEKQGFFPLDLNKFDLAVTSRLRLLQPEDYTNIPYIAGGLENRFYNAVLQSECFTTACDSAKSKNITHARVRRSLLCAALQIKQQHFSQSVPYLRILASNKHGHEILNVMRKTCKIPIIMKHADSKYLDSYAKEIYDLNMKANDLYSLCLPKPTACGQSASHTIYIKKD